MENQKMHIGKEIVLKVPNKAGVLADISKALAVSGVNIDAIAGYAKEDGKEAEMMLVTGNNSMAMSVLKKSQYTLISEREVVILEVENKSGILKNIAAKLAENNIDIKYIYGTTSIGKCASRIILTTNDNKKVLEVLG